MKSFKLFFLLCSALYADSLSDTSTAFKQGGYLSYTHFKAMAPSVVDETFELQYDEGFSVPGDSTFSLFHNKRGRVRVYQENLWGFSDGKAFFVAVGGGAVSAQKFRKLEIRRFFSFYAEPYSVPASVSGGRMGDPDILAMNYYVVDMKTGLKAPLTKPSLREILRKEDTALYQQFLADKYAADRTVEYVEMLNQRMAQKN